MTVPLVILLGSALLLAGAVPCLSDSAPSPIASPSSGVAHDGYLRTVKLRMSEWRVKLADLDARASGATTDAGKNAEAEISTAWARVELAADRLSAVGESGWLQAKATYERAADHLDAAWARFMPTKS